MAKPVVKDEGMNEMELSYKRYLAAMLESSDFDINESVTRLNTSQFRDSAPTNCYEGTANKASTSSVYGLDESAILELRRQSLDIDERTRRSKQKLSFIFTVTLVTLCMLSAIAIVFLYLTHINGSRLISIISKKLHFMNMKEFALEDNNKVVNAFIEIPGSNHFLDLISIDKNCFQEEKSGQHFRSLSYDVSDSENYVISDNICNYVDGVEGMRRLKTNVRLSVFIQNPLIRAIKSFYERQDPNNPFFSQELIGLSIEEYLNSTLLENNSLTRLLVCKSNDNNPLNVEDFRVAKKMLEWINTISILNQRDSIKTIQSKLMGVVNKKKCVNRRRAKRRLMGDLEVSRTIDRYLSILKSANQFDMSLYSYVLTGQTTNELKLL